MKITNRPTLVGALVGALALGVSIDVATAQYTQDSSRVPPAGQNTTPPTMPQAQDTSMAGQTGRVNPAGQDTSMRSTQDTSMRQQTGATSDTGMKKSKSKQQKKTAATDTGAVGQQKHKGGMTHDTTRAMPDTSH